MPETNDQQNDGAYVAGVADRAQETTAQQTAGMPARANTVMATLNSALSIGQALAADLASIASATGNAKVASHINAGLDTFQVASGPLQDVEQLAASLLGVFSTLATAHAASKLRV